MTLRLALRIGLSTLALGLPSLCFAADGEPIVMGQRFQLRSESMGAMRSYLVHRPPNYDISNARYPVLIVLDGNEHFQHASATVDFLAGAGRIPPMLVVGIPNADRRRDLSSYSDAPGPSALLKFITDELVPKIDRDYRTRPYRLLMGWSSAGLFALHAMINAPETFRGYLLAVPAFGDERALPKAVGAFFDAHKDPFLNADLFMAAADETGSNLAGAFELSSYLQQRASRVRDLRFTFRRYPEESHGSVPLRTVYDGLRTLFEGWEIDNPFAIYDQGGLAAIEKHFAALSERLGFPVAVPDEALFATFGQLEYRKRFPEADQVIKRAIELYPDSTTALYYAGRLYMEMGNTPLAVETLKKSLLLSPNDGGARSLLTEMKVDASEVVPQVHVTPKDVAKYVGGYGSSAVVFEIERRGDGIIGKTAEKEYELEALSGTRFHWSDHNVYSNGGTVSFRADSRGRVTGLVFENGGAELKKVR
jgi:hypothetical protein